MDRGRRIVVVSAVLLSACATTIVEQRYLKSYTVGQEVAAATGNPMLVDQNGYVTRQRVWVGILNSADGWKDTEQFSSDYYRKELIYSGISGSTVELNYREFRGGYAAQAFYQSVKYDLSQSATVRFQNFTIAILSADNEKIRYKIIKDY